MDEDLKDTGCGRCGTDVCLLPDPQKTNHDLGLCPCQCTCGPECDHAVCPCDECVAARGTKATNAWEEKRAARVERLRQRSERLGRLAEAGHARARQLASIIPFGQPILVGHHSEGRDVRYRAKIDRAYTKSFEAAKESEDLARRADVAEASTAVSSDDPDAVAKLRAKLARLENFQKEAVLVNRLLRSKKTDEEIALAIGGRCRPETVAELRKPDFAGRTGVPDHKVKNNGAEIRRTKQRIAHLERVAAEPPKAPEVFGDTRVEEVDNRVRVFFPGKPSEAVRSRLKSGGFRWSPTVGAWQAYPSFYTRELARKVASDATVDS